MLQHLSQEDGSYEGVRAVTSREAAEECSPGRLALGRSGKEASPVGTKEVRAQNEPITHEHR